MNLRSCLKLLFGLLLLTVALSIFTFYMYFRTGGGTWIVQLPGDYLMGRSYGNNIAISRKSNGSEVIGPPIDGYAVYGHLIVGHVGKPEAGSATQEGYFLIDTRNDFIRKKLSRDAFLRLASKYGLPKQLKLYRPSRWIRCRR